MATPVRRIEKEFLLKALYDERIPIKYIKDHVEYILALDHPATEEIVFRLDRSIGKLKTGSRMELLFNYRGQVVDFSVTVNAHKDEVLFCNTPDTLYKDLDRNFLRVDTPSDISIVFTFRGDRYNLSFPKIAEYENIEASELFRSTDPGSLSGLMEQMKGWIKEHASGHRIGNFKDKKPETIEERIISETGKALYIPSTLGFLPKTDPYPKKRIITEEIFRCYLESTGMNEALIDDVCSRFIKAKFEKGILSDAWIPILFHEYVVGYIHLWVNKEGNLPFDYSVLDNMYDFSKILAFSLKENGYFERGKMPNEPFEGKVLDISASGLLFAYPHSTHSAALLVDSELSVKIITPKRFITVIARIVRRFKDKLVVYFGCRFTNLAPEDLRFLFEYLYGKPMDDAEAMFLSGQV